jgi:hypothetical protein
VDDLFATRDVTLMPHTAELFGRLRATLGLPSVLLATLAAACGGGGDRASSADSLSRDTLPWTVSFTGFGPIRAGMSYDTLTKTIAGLPVGDAVPPAECRFVVLPDDRAVRVMIVKDTVVRVDIDSGAIATNWGDRIGDSETQILARHDNRGRVEPHKYTGPTGHYLILTDPADSLRRIVFETDGARALRYRAGRWPEVGWVEGCG